MLKIEHIGIAVSNIEDANNIYKSLLGYSHYKTEIVERDDLKSFEINQTKTELIIGCGKNSLKILELQQEGKKRMTVDEFLRGFSFKQA